MITRYVSTKSLSERGGRRLQRGALPLAISLLILATFAMECEASETPKVAPDACDLEWDRLKSLPPVSRREYEEWVARPEPKFFKGLTGADMYYYLARVPLVIGVEGIPTTDQRRQWLESAIASGHKAARATLVRERYFNAHLSPTERPSREEFLIAAREAASAGDPEFAAVMMDTAFNLNALFHCRREDRSPTSMNSCAPQSVVERGEARSWAEVAARSGHPHAKSQLCKFHYFGNHTDFGFEKSPSKAFAWCFASEATACSAEWNAGILANMYERGEGTSSQPERAAEIRSRYPVPRAAYKRIVFPLMSR